MKRFLINMAIVFGFILLLKLFNNYNAISFLFGAIAESIISTLNFKYVKN